MLEAAGTEQWLLARLSSDAAIITQSGGRIYADFAPQDSAFPAIVYQFRRGQAFSAIDGSRSKMRLILLVKVVTEWPNADTGQDLFGLVDARLYKATGSVPGLSVDECVQDEPIQYTEFADGKRYFHVGGLYHLWVEKI